MTAGWQGLRIHHLTPRTPRKALGFSWGRRPTRNEDQVSVVTYRLFIRDSQGVLFAQTRTFDKWVPRDRIALVLRGMRVQLRWVVDQVEFTRLGLVDTTPEPRVPA